MNRRDAYILRALAENIQETAQYTTDLQAATEIETEMLDWLERKTKELQEHIQQMRQRQS